MKKTEWITIREFLNNFVMVQNDRSADQQIKIIFFLKISLVFIQKKYEMRRKNEK